MCEVLEVGRTSYYDWLKSIPSQRALENQEIGTKSRKFLLIATQPMVHAGSNIR